MDAATNPIEAGLEWVVRFSKEGFIGKDALARIKAQGVARTLVGLEIEGHRTVRNGYPLYAGGKPVGQVTSGPLSRALSGRNLGLGYVATEHARAGTLLEVAIGDRKSKARVVPTQFCARRVKEEPAVTTFSPYDLRFSDSHVWARVDEGARDVVVLGLSDFGQRILGDILSVDLPEVGDRVTKGSAAARLDSYRRPCDVVSPVSGEVVEVGESLVGHPERINAYPYARSGLLKVRVATPREIEALMPFEGYAALTERLQRYDEWFKDRRMT
jgi:glycine cleavage system H protein